MRGLSTRPAIAAGIRSVGALSVGGAVPSMSCSALQFRTNTFLIPETYKSGTMLLVWSRVHRVHDDKTMAATRP
jgi:hypothetical protein